MNTWAFDLTQTVDPILRLGLHGLYRLLHEVDTDPEQADLYVLVKRSVTLHWDLTDTTIALHWGSPEDLNVLLRCQLGTFPDGIGVPPGWCSDPALPGFYATARAHGGIVSYFSAMKGARRSRSLGPDATGELELNWVKAHGKHPVRKVDNVQKARTEGNVEQSVTPHNWAPQECLQLATDKKGRVEEMQSGGFALHPAWSQSNKIGVKVPAQHAFVGSFSCLSYVFLFAGTGKEDFSAVGLGLDAATFPAALNLHRKWSNRGPSKSLLSVRSHIDTAFWLVSALLDLEDRVYATLTGGGPGCFRPHSMQATNKLVYELLRQTLAPEDVKGTLYQLSTVPTRVIADDVVESVHDVLLQNLARGDHWYRSLGNVLSAFQKKNTIAKPGHQDVLHILNSTLGDSMEQQIIHRMAENVKRMIVMQQQENPGSDWDKSTKKVYQKVSMWLGHAFTAADIMSGLYTMGRHLNGPILQEEEANWIAQLAGRDPSLARSLLLLGCVSRAPKWEKENAEVASAAEAEEPSENAEFEPNDYD